MTKGKKTQNNRRKKLQANTVTSQQEMTRREVIVNTLVAGVASTVVGGEILKYLPGPTPMVALAPAKPLPATSIAILWGKPTTPIQDDDSIPNRIA